MSFIYFMSYIYLLTRNAFSKHFPKISGNVKSTGYVQKAFRPIKALRQTQCLSNEVILIQTGRRADPHRLQVQTRLRYRRHLQK
jgi:hypothetical protein